MKKRLSILLLLVLGSCSPELPDSQSLIDELLESKVSDYKAKKNKECRNDALADAEAHVDSIVHRLLNLDLIDTIDFPSKPMRPRAPKHIIGTVDKFEVNGK